MSTIIRTAGRTARRVTAACGLLLASTALVSGASDVATSDRLAGYGTSDVTSGAEATALTNTGSLAARTFGIAGSVARLYPGHPVGLTLIITNPFSFTITVTSVGTAVGNASASCPGRYLSVTRFRGEVPVRARRQARVRVTATMAHTAPNACQGVRFPLHYSGSAVR